MKTILIIPILAVALLGCKTHKEVITPQKEVVLKKAIAKAAVPPPEVSFAIGPATATALTSTQMPTDPNAPPELITHSTKFAAVCPYCGKVNTSKSCLPAGGATITNAVMQKWVITFKCRKCSMDFNDFRNQELPNTTSVRLPIVGE